MTTTESRLRKTLTANDVGATGSHQAGIHVPKSLLRFFPDLVRSTLNPDAWLVISIGNESHRWRFIHYNNAVVASGTRDEYRLTHVTKSLRGSGAAAGDTLELARIENRTYSLRVIQAGRESEVLVLSADGPWRVVHLRRHT